ncbi:MAG: hypothetical protein HXX14_05265 [Bacteroidetes bacterium]|nr:hypothetical protein [Bacteroidota bacterium]
MKNLNHLLTLIVLVTLCFGAYGQDNVNNASENGRIGLTAYVPQQVDKISEGTGNMLVNKLNQIATQNGFAGDAYFSRFILTANIVPLTKDILATAPPMIALTLEITLYIGDSEGGTLFASKSITLKGVGTNETKAYIDAIKKIRPSDPQFDSFLEEGKSKIINYYNTKCDAILKQAQVLTNTNNLEEAIELLMGIPDVCMDCYNKSMEAVAPIYQQLIDRDCQKKLAEATHIWNANQTIEAANEAGRLLSTIEPRAACFRDVKTLANRISKRVYEIDKREWNFVLREQQINSQLESEKIRAYRDVAIARARRRPPVTVIEHKDYIIKNWINIH